MKRLISLFSLLAWLPAMATSQAMDEIVTEQGLGRLWMLPLESMPAATGFKERLSQLVCDGRASSNWRGYIARWLTRDGKLWLVQVLGKAKPCEHQSSSPVPLEVLFPGSSGPILASWFSGQLAIGMGTEFKCAGQPWLTYYSQVETLTIESGNVTGTSLRPGGCPSEKD